jgi:hypothetical protein
LGEALGKVFGRGKKESESSTTAQGEKPAAPVAVPEKVYLKALPLRDLEDVEMIKQEVKLGNVLILKVSPLARKSIDDVKTAVSQLMDFTQSVGGDIARLGEERVVITPAFIRIWREKAATAGGALPTAA